MATGHYNNPPALPGKQISKELGQKLDQVAQEKGLTRRQLLYILGGGAAVVTVAGVSGGVALSNSGSNSARGAAASVLNPGESESPKTPVINENENKTDAPIVNEPTNPADFYDNYEVSADGNVVYLDPVGGKDGTHGRGLRGTHSFIDRKEMERRVEEWQKIFEGSDLEEVEKRWREATSSGEAETRDPITEYYLYSNQANLKTPDGFPEAGVNSKDKTATLIVREIESMKNGGKIPQKYFDKYLVLMRASVGGDDDPFSITQSNMESKDPKKLEAMKKYWQNLDYGSYLANN